MLTRARKPLLFAILIAQVALCHCWVVKECLAQAAPAGVFPYREEPVNYFSDDLSDPVSTLRRKVERGDVRLEFEAGTGHLRSLLKALGVSESSQMLVFARNSVHARLISPDNPRALYYSDAAYIGFVPGAPFLEVSAIDPRKGTVFYTVSQKKGEPPAFNREESCLLCHASGNSLNVPGQLVRSFVTDTQGNPTRGHSKINHDSPYAQRWGGWYVTGDSGRLPHLGNLSTAADLLDHDRHPDGPGRAVALASRIDASKYLSRHSDIAALLVHDHQTWMHNLITRVNYEHQYERRENSEEALLHYLLFADEPALENPVLGNSSFETVFARQGPRDGQGRSLRDLDLETRLFKYRCSFLIYSAAFDNLPDAVKGRLYRRLWEALSAEAPPSPFDRLPRAERRAILEILRDTKPGLPEYWKSSI